MSQPIPIRSERYVVAGAGALIMLVGLAILAAWLADLALLKSGGPAGWVSMKANAALGLSCLGLALLAVALPEFLGAWAAWVVGVAAGTALLVGAVTFGEYLFTWSAGIDALLVREAPGAIGTAQSVRMAPDAALCLVLGALGVLFAQFHERRLRVASQALGLVLLVSALWWLYHYASGPLAGAALYTAMAPHTAILFGICGAALFALHMRELPAPGEKSGDRVGALTPWAFLILGVAGTHVLWRNSADEILTRAQQQFDQQATAAQTALLDGLRKHERMLRAAAALLQVTPDAGHATWRDYVAALDLAHNYPGVQAVGLARAVSRAQLPALVARLRRETGSKYSVWPPGARPEYVPVQYLEPFDWRARLALGFDMLSNPARRAAMARARDSGTPALSAKVTLAFETERDLQPGFLLYIPVYRTGAVIDTPEQRHRALSAFVYAPFRAHNFLSGMLPADASIGFSIYDGSEPDEQALLYRTEGARLVAGRDGNAMLATTRTVEFAGQSWLLRAQSLPTFDAALEQQSPILILGAGALLTLLVFAATWVLVEGRIAAERAARERDAKLRRSEFSFRAMVQAVQDYAIITLDPQGNVTSWNRGAERIKGYTQSEIIGRHFSVFYPREEVERGKPQAMLDSARSASVQDEGWRVRKDGSRIWASVVITPVFDEEGALSGYVKVTRDNTALMEADLALRNANVALESRVRERTHELADTNARLQRDISLRERAERALRESEERLQAILDNAPAVVYVKNLDGTYVFINREFENLFHLKREEVRGKTDYDYFPREMADAYARNDRGVIEANEAVEAEEIAPVDGIAHTYLSVKFPLRDASGKPYALCGISTDITERKKAQDRVRDSEERLNLALRSSGIGTWDWDIATGAITWDDYMHPLFGLAPRSFPGGFGDFMRLVHPDDRAGVAEAVRLAVEEHAEYESEFRVVWADGTVRSITARGQVYRDEGEQPLRMTGVCWDVTERRKAEIAVRESEERLQAILDNAPAVVWVKDLEGHYTFLNRVFEQTFKTAREQVLHKTDYEVFEKDAAERFHEFDHQVLSRAASVEAEEVAIIDGQAHTFLSVKTPLRDSQGRTYALCGISTDISERKQAEDKLKALAERLARSNRELEDFARVASHDLQEPLRKVQAFSERLNTKYAQALDDQGRDYIARMQDAVRRMGTLIQDLLVYSRVTTKAQPFAATDLTKIAEEVRSDLEARIEQTGGSVEIGELPVIEADPMQMRQLLQNLIGNALKFHRPQVAPAVSVSARMRGRDPHVVCEVTVEDNGIGFDNQYAERIFGVFQRLHGRGEFEGSGVGLAVCQKIAERHGGSIVANGRPGNGATFIVKLPVTQERGGNA